MLQRLLAKRKKIWFWDGLHSLLPLLIISRRFQTILDVLGPCRIVSTSARSRLRFSVAVTDCDETRRSRDVKSKRREPRKRSGSAKEDRHNPTRLSFVQTFLCSTFTKTTTQHIFLLDSPTALLRKKFVCLQLRLHMLSAIVFRVLALALFLILGLLVGTASAFVPSTRTTTTTTSNSRFTTSLHVASADTPVKSIDHLGRGMGGRIEEAFAAAKQKGEAAFVTFVTAGYPTAKGTFPKMNLRSLTVTHNAWRLQQEEVTCRRKRCSSVVCGTCIDVASKNM